MFVLEFKEESYFSYHVGHRGTVVKGVEHISTNLLAGSSPADSVGRDINSQKLHYEYLKGNYLFI